MQTITSIREMREAIKHYKSLGKIIGFVPTMGNLHDGHLSLVKNIQTKCDIIITSIFINPLQFSEITDYTSYPQTLEADTLKLTNISNDIVFIPSKTDIYPDDQQSKTFVSVPELDNILCGKSRKGHLTGVATIVTKLLNIVQPDIAIFGNKDYQQLLVIQQLVKDLNIPTRIMGSPIIRAENGLALSSRNNHLNSEQLEIASRLHQILQIIKQSILAGERNYREIENQTLMIINESGFIADYFEIRTHNKLKLATEQDQDIILFIAAKIGKTRLIDNIQFKVK